MPLDSICIAALKNELETQIAGMRVDKIQQPEKDTLLFSLRGGGKNHKLLICAGTGNARVNLTVNTYENPASPPMFCMLMRKHLVGGRVKELFQPPFERLLGIRFETSDQLGDLSEKTLYVELMGSASNIVLVENDGIIVDCMRRITGDFEGVRRVLPGLKYHLPDRQDKELLTEHDTASLLELIKSANPEKRAEKWLLESFMGISPLICREICCEAYGDTDILLENVYLRDRGVKLAEALLQLVSRLNNADFDPSLLTDNSAKPRDFSFMHIRQYGDHLMNTPYDSFSALLDAYYSKRDKIESMRRRSQAVTKSIKSARDRVERRVALQKEELRKTEDRDKLRKYGDIIMANIYSMTKRMDTLHAVDFYSENNDEVDIPLDPLKTPQENAARYFKEYNKAKTAQKHLSELVKTGEDEVTYLNSVLDALQRAETERDVMEIRQELTEYGYLRQLKQAKKEKPIVQGPMHFKSATGFDIYAGKNNSQNERLTHKLSSKQDVWLHAQKIHGSHTVIFTNGREVDEQTVLDAAAIAAYYSQGKDSAKVPVDYTTVKYVKRQGSGKPGMVTYTNFKTVYVQPSDERIEKLRVK